MQKKIEKKNNISNLSKVIRVLDSSRFKIPFEIIGLEETGKSLSTIPNHIKIRL
jgi:hypothetical protein